MAIVLLAGRLITAASGLRGDGFATGRRYTEAIERAGGVVLHVPPTEAAASAAPELVEHADGLLLQGGGDVEPTRYGQPNRSDHLYGISRAHDEVEIALVRAALARDIPVLGICRGMQVLNVALGGTLVQDIGERIADRESHWDTYHDVEIHPGSRLHDAMGPRPARCHSYHHQVVGDVATDFNVVANAPDGVIEAIEHRHARWVVGVQWHPEDDADRESAQQRLFDRFVGAMTGATSS